MVPNQLTLELDLATKTNYIGKPLCIEIETSKIYKTIQTPQEHNPDFSTLNNHENLVKGDLLFVASSAAVALVAIVAISTSNPAKALAPEDESSPSDSAKLHRLTKETIKPESAVSNTYNNKPQGCAALTIAWKALLAGLGRENVHC